MPLYMRRYNKMTLLEKEVETKSLNSEYNFPIN